VSSEATLGGYMAKHGRAAAFTGQDGQPYSVGIFVEEQPDQRGRYGASLLFVRWSPAGDRPVGHVETEVLAWGRTRARRRTDQGAFALRREKRAR
jgi:hypothetical protein